MILSKIKDITMFRIHMFKQNYIFTKMYFEKNITVNRIE